MEDPEDNSVGPDEDDEGIGTVGLTSGGEGGVHVVKFDLCMLGMRTNDRQGKLTAAKKRITVMTNSPAVATLLREAQCRSERLHAPLLEGRAGPC